MKLAASCAALGCGASALTPIEPKAIERPEIGRRAGQHHIDGQPGVIVERDPILAGAH
jgi:hypothetical protein